MKWYDWAAILAVLTITALAYAVGFIVRGVAVLIDTFNRRSIHA